MVQPGSFFNNNRELAKEFEPVGAQEEEGKDLNSSISSVKVEVADLQKRT